MAAVRVWNRADCCADRLLGAEVGRRPGPGDGVPFLGGWRVGGLEKDHRLPPPPPAVAAAAAAAAGKDPAGREPTVLEWAEEGWCCQIT